MDTRQVIARFEAERQALAMMDHPNIAKVFDAGATDTGRPYFVMELVTRRADHRVLRRAPAHASRSGSSCSSQVCHAIQHAHQKGIIHRDIKPSNVLVTMHDGEPLAKVIDFGIAKAIEQPLTDKTHASPHFGQMIGTPLYMSPEQAEGQPRHRHPQRRLFAGRAALRAADRHARRSIAAALRPQLARRDAAHHPRGRAADAQRAALHLRDTVPRARGARARPSRRELVSLLRGELDWIVMKALEKDPTRRYETANALASDVQRYLAGEPVMAAPPSARLQLRKFVARHRGPVIAATLVGASLIAGLAGTVWQARVAARQRDAARKEAARATALNEFMEQMLDGVGPRGTGRRAR